MDEARERRRNFGLALARALNGKGTHQWLGTMVGEQPGVLKGVSGSAVTQWVNGETEPAPHTVFAVERVLGCRPGKLSQLLGYLPVGWKPARTVLEALDADPALTDDMRGVVKAAYRAATRS